MDRRKLGREFYELGLRLGGLGTVAIGSGGGELAKALARAAGCGVSLTGAAPPAGRGWRSTMDSPPPCLSGRRGSRWSCSSWTGRAGG